MMSLNLVNTSNLNCDIHYDKFKKIIDKTFKANSILKIDKKDYTNGNFITILDPQDILIANYDTAILKVMFICHQDFVIPKSCYLNYSKVILFSKDRDDEYDTIRIFDHSGDYNCQYPDQQMAKED